VTPKPSALPGRAGPLSFAAGVLLTHTRTRGSRALLSLSKRCTRMFTRTHALASELPRRRGHPSRDAAELEPHRAVYHRAVVLVRELHLTTARSFMRSTKLSPLLSLLESGEHVCACEPSLIVAQPVTAGTLSSRASFPPRRASSRPTRVRVRSRAHECVQPHRRRPPQSRRRNLLLCSARQAGLRRCRAKNPTKAASFPCPNRALGFDRPCLRAC
jgi:hypothetical protein